MHKINASHTSGNGLISTLYKKGMETTQKKSNKL
jgi:hypothetical protein